MSRSSLACYILIAVMSLSVGCAHPHHPRRPDGPPPAAAHKPGPPPHAPAHGYRHKHAHQGVTLVFNTQLGVYRVSGRDDYFFHADQFYRFLSGRWQVSTRINGRWTEIHSGKLPKRLAKRYRKAEKRGKGRAQHPAKHGY